MIVSVSRGGTPRSRRLTPSGRWPEDPLTVVLEPGVGFEPAPDLKEAEPDRSDRTPVRPLAERVLLHLLRCDPHARPPARPLANALDCSGRRYPDLRAALDELLDAGRIDHGPAAGHDASQRLRLCAHRGGTRQCRSAPHPVRYQRFRQWKRAVNERETHGGNAVRFRFRFPPPPGGSGNVNGNDDLQAVRCRARGNVLRCSGRYLPGRSPAPERGSEAVRPSVSSRVRSAADGRTDTPLAEAPALPCSRRARLRGWLARTVVPSAPGAGWTSPAPNAGSAGGADAAPGRTWKGGPASIPRP